MLLLSLSYDFDVLFFLMRDNTTVEYSLVPAVLGINQSSESWLNCNGWRVSLECTVLEDQNQKSYKLVCVKFRHNYSKYYKCNTRSNPLLCYCTSLSQCVYRLYNLTITANNLTADTIQSNKIQIISLFVCAFDQQL